MIRMHSIAIDEELFVCTLQRSCFSSQLHQWAILSLVAVVHYVASMAQMILCGGTFLVKISRNRERVKEKRKREETHMLNCKMLEYAFLCANDISPPLMIIFILLPN